MWRTLQQLIPAAPAENLVGRQLQSKQQHNYSKNMAPIEVYYMHIYLLKMLMYVSNFSDLRDASLGPLQDSGDDGRGAGAGVRV